MELNRRLIGASAVVLPDGKVTDVDISGLLRRLLLFDKYVLVTVRLQEFPFIARYLGYEGLRDLLAANLIEIRCECLQLTQVGQGGLFGDQRLPAFNYKFNWIDAHDKEKYVHDGLQHLHGSAGLRHKQVVKLKAAIAKAIRPLPAGIRSELWPEFQNELLHHTPLVKKSVELVVNQRLGLREVPFSLRIHQQGEETFTVETDLQHRAGIGEQQAHQIVEAGLLGIAGLSQSIGEMKAYSAISGFLDEDLPLFRHKLNFLADSLSSEIREQTFRRVINLAGLPDFPAAEGAISVENLLKVRASSEAGEFRDWLGGVSQASDKEIRERVASLKAKAGLMVGGGTGKAMRFLVTTGIGLIPGATIPSIALGAADQFLVDKLLPRSGVAAFVNELYPSLFKIAK
jgi:hypothetical protein